MVTEGYPFIILTCRMICGCTETIIEPLLASRDLQRIRGCNIVEVSSETLRGWPLSSHIFALARSMIGIHHCVDNSSCRLLYFVLVNCSTLQGALLSIYAPLLDSHVYQSVTGCEKNFCCLSKTFTLTSQKIKSSGMTYRNFWKWALRALRQTTLVAQYDRSCISGANLLS